MVAADAALALQRQLALGREVRFPDGSSRAGRHGPVAECPKPAEAVLVDMAGVGLEAASLKAAARVKAAGASGQAAANPGKAARTAIAMAATAAAASAPTPLKARAPATRSPVRDRLIDGRMIIFPSLFTSSAETVDSNCLYYDADRMSIC